MKFSYNLLQKYFKGKLPEPKKLSEILTLRSFEIESVDKAKNDYVLQADILPNRMTDAAGHYWFAKEISAILGLKFKEILPYGEKELKVKKINFQRNGGKFDIKIENKNLCLRYIGVLMRDVSVAPSPAWLKNSLLDLGLNSINNLVDAANYVMLLTNQPLHIFDFDKISDAKIIARSANKGENIITLDNKKYDLGEDILVIADSREPLAIAGIKGGKKAEVDFNTKNIIIEAASFDRAAIRRASKKLDLKTDASARFGAGIDGSLAEFGALSAVSLIKDLLGAKTKIAEAVDVCVAKSAPKFIKIDFNKVRTLLGAEILDKEIKNILVGLGIKLKPVLKSKTAFIAEPPRARRDLENENDLIEEAGRIYGYEKIKAISSKIEISEEEDRNKQIFTEKIKNILAAQGFYETYNYSFVGDKDLDFLPEKDKNCLLRLQNPINPESEFLRPFLLSNILKAASFNFKNFFSDFRLFELGKTYKFLDGKPSEADNLAVIIASRDGSGKDLFYKIKGALSYLTDTTGAGEARFVPFSGLLEDNWLMDIFCEFDSGEIKRNDKTLGFFGEIKKDILNKYDIKKEKVFAFEIDFDLLFSEAEKEAEYAPFSKFPPAIRDLSLLLPYNTRVEEIENVIQNVGGETLFDVDLFDMYEGAGGDGRKSMAFRLVFQSYDRTLSDTEINGLMDKIIKALEENPEWEVRK